MYLAIILVCTTPHISMCELIQHPKVYGNLDECRESVVLGAREFQESNFYTLGRCINVPFKFT